MDADSNKTIVFTRCRAERKATLVQRILLVILPALIGVLLVCVGLAVGSRL